MLQADRYYSINIKPFNAYTKNLFPQQKKILAQMLKHNGNQKLYVVSLSPNGKVEVAGWPGDALLGTMFIPSECLKEDTMSESHKIKERVLVKASDVNALIESMVQEAGPMRNLGTGGVGGASTPNNGPEQKADMAAPPVPSGDTPAPDKPQPASPTAPPKKPEPEFNVQDDLRNAAYDDFISKLDDLETSFAALYLATEKVKDFDVQDIGKEGYPFGASLPDMYHKVIHWNAAQKIDKFRKTGDKP